METRRRSERASNSTMYTPDPAYKLSHSSINNYQINHNQCHSLNEKYYLIMIDPYTNEALKETLPIITNMTELDNGLYIYVMLSFDNEPPVMYCMRTYTLFEIGTKHHQLIHRIACLNESCKRYLLYYAGELEKTDDLITFNFYSGTFNMQTKITKKKMSKDIEFVKTYMSSFLNDALEVEFVDSPLITRDKLLFTYEDLDTLKRIGAIIYEFDDREICKQHARRVAVSPLFSTNQQKPDPNILRHSVLYGGKTKKRRVNKFKKSNRRK